MTTRTLSPATTRDTPTAAKILIVEDNRKMAEALQRGLRDQGYAPEICSSGEAGESRAIFGTETGDFDLIILDLMLPDRDGLEVCRNLRTRGVTSPVLMLTALSGTQDKVTGLDAGADDYLTKPFEFDELVARVRAILRRHESRGGSRVLRCGDLELDLYTRKARRGETEVELSNKEFALLEYLMRNPGRVLSRPEIAENVWDLNVDPSSNVIDVYVSTLRKKIERGFNSDLFHTVKGVGYRFGLDG